MRRILIVALLLLAANTAYAASLVDHTQTIVTLDGMRIEYLAADGHSYMWFGGNSRMARGEWKSEGGNVCFKHGGDWECLAITVYNEALIDSSKGDIYGLAGRKNVPFILPRMGLPKNQILAILYPKPERPVDAKAECKAILDRANTSKAAMADAAMLYYHGMWMGVRCVPVDYIKAFELLDRAGDKKLRISLLKDLRTKADAGMLKAQAALKKLEP